jgi:hypothetical protein
MAIININTRFAIAGCFLASTALTASAAQVFTQDVIVQGSECIGIDCASSESFGSDTLRMKENNLRIHFDDTSASASFPGNDWRISINSQDSGGASYFSVDDATAGTTPFKIDAGAGNNALMVTSSGGNVGMGTASPVVELHVVDGDSPALRLEQNGASGWTPQTWDLASNETNFFIRDVTNGSKLPFKIKPGAPDNALFIAADGDIGLGTAAPAEKLDVKGTIKSTLGLIENTGAKATRDLLELKNSGNPQLLFNNTNPANPNEWRLSAGKNFLIKNGTNETVMQVAPEGMVSVDATDASSGARDALLLTNNGNPQIALANTNNGNTWRISAGNRFVLKNNAGTTVSQLDASGNLLINGQITTVGGSCGGGCDMTFVEPEKRVKSIEEHAKLMWENSHLPAVGPTVENQPINLSEKTGGMLHELEVAHIYIEQLHKRLSEKESVLTEVMQRLEALEDSSDD